MVPFYALLINSIIHCPGVYLLLEGEIHLSIYFLMKFILLRISLDKMICRDSSVRNFKSKNI